MNFDIDPYTAVGPIAFGLDRAQVRARLGGRVDAFRKTESSEALADAFADYDIHVHYDAQDRCEAIEFGKGHGTRHAVPTFNGQPLVGQPLPDVRRWLTKIDPNLRTLDSLTVAFGLGFGVGAAPRQSQLIIDDVIVFRRGYYDGEDFLV